MRQSRSGSQRKKTINWSAIPPAVRLRCAKKRCAICRQGYGSGEFRRRVNGRVRFFSAIEQLHHILPKAWLHERHLNPHRPENLLSTCACCHGLARKADERLMEGDFLGFVQQCLRMGIPGSSLRRALEAYDFNPSFLLNPIIRER